MGILKKRGNDLSNQLTVLKANFSLKKLTWGLNIREEWNQRDLRKGEKILYWLNVF